MTIGLISSDKYKNYLKEIQKKITNLNHKCFILNASSDMVENCELLVRNIQKGKVERGIAIDDYGIMPFMYIAKTPKIIVAQIADEHSAHMTCAHNNATVLSFGGEISTLHQIQNMIMAFINSKYEGGRHKVRIDMLNTLTEGQ
ncbi:MAG: RpiB/LacA/LacB family sugar-phosphate isomerase [Mycoplasmataceae bacterium]|jgi:galactose-6-phosphate isomerase|nr:RpiB/LacA/LacB family sugar-phosphate isomerase [Mycoplasmataceae bacterium]